jgi:uncharacterized membrane protein
MQAATSSDARGYRLAALDILRGLVVVVMALDHVRDYFHAGAEQDPMANPNVGLAIFFTRWVTHFCAPVFVFLAGTSAGLMRARRGPASLASFLLKRGVWLIAVEATVVSLAWTFAPRGTPELQGQTLVALGVIWVIGASMVVLAVAQRLGRPVCLGIGAVAVLGHNLLDAVWPTSQLFDTSQPLWVALHAQMGRVVGPFFIAFVYPLLPWTGVMLLGFGSAGLFEREPTARPRALVTWGLAAVAAFVVLRASHLYGDPNPWSQQSGGVLSTAIDFLNVTKYPPSALYLLMTLGPSAVLAACADRLPGPFRRWLTAYGRAPFAFYIAHLYLIHAASLVLGVLQGFQPGQMMTVVFFYPKGFGLPLAGVYVVWFAIVAALYPLCRWVADIKARRTDWWLSYL